MSDLLDSLLGDPRFPRVSRIVRLLGLDALLLPWPVGSKGEKKKWGHLTAAAMQDRQHLLNLEAGNIGVALGSVSGGLCSFDGDSDRALDAFLDANTPLRASLRSHGARGGNVWLRVHGVRPATRKLRCAGEAVGEWRSDRSQTIISGKHPSGSDYRLSVDAPPVTVAFSDIAWPAGWTIPGLPNERIRFTRDADVKPISVSSSSVQPAVLIGFTDAFLLTGRHQSDAVLMRMASAVKTAGADAGEVFDRWYQRNSQHLDPSEGYAVYRRRFAAKLARATVNRSSLAEAEAALESVTDPLERLRELCRILADKDSCFFLDCRTAGRVAGVGYATAWRWLHTRCGIKMETRGNSSNIGPRVANVWRILPPALS